MNRMYHRHGHAQHGKVSLEYRVWSAMIQRCSNPNDKKYRHYGGRGIQVCERWHDFRNFIADMGTKTPGLTLERKNNDKGYEPGNCVWATYKEQANNCRPKSTGPVRQRWFYGHGPHGEMIVENNQHHVARVFGLQNTLISHCLCGKRKTHKEWTFRRIT